MKLHLPKALSAAIVAAFMIPAAYAYTLHPGEQTLEQDEIINDTQSLTGTVNINGKGWQNQAGHSLTLEADTDSSAHVSIDGNLEIVSQCHLKINEGTSLSTTGTLSIGHDLSGYPADLTMTGGELSVSKFCFNGNHANAATITGGTLTVTGETAVTHGHGHGSTSVLTIGGTSTDNVLLKTGTANNVTFDYSNLKLGNVTVDANNTQAIIVTGNATLTGSITNNANASRLQLGNVSIAADTQEAITITNATLSGTITNQAGADKLILKGNIDLLPGSNYLTISSGQYYSDETTVSSSGNGYFHADFSANFGDTLTLAEGSTLTCEGHTLTSNSDGNYTATFTDMSTYFVKNGIVDEQALLADNKVTGDTAYSIEGGTLQAAGDISNNRLSYTSGALNVSQGNKLTIDADKNDVVPLLLNTEGQGNVELNNNITVTLGDGSATKLTGSLIVNSGATLQLANDNFSGGSTGATSVDLSSLSSLTLNGGTVRYRGAATTDKTALKKMEVTADSTFNLWDMDSTASAFTIKSMVLSSKLNITSSWKYNLEIGALSGTGDLHLHPGSTAEGDKQTATINVTKDYTGKLLLDGGSNMTVNLSVESDATAKIKGNNVDNFTTTLASVTLRNNSTLKAITQGASHAGGRSFTLNSVTVDGTAGIAIDGEAVGSENNNGYQGLVNIEELTNVGVNAGTLTLSSHSNTSMRSVFNLNGGDFEGTIKIKQLHTGDDRKAALNIRHATAASKAVIDLHAEYGSVALGIAVDGATVKGITGDSGGIYSGEQAGEVSGNFAGDGTDRTLIIDTGDNGHYSTTATLGDHLNLTKKGAGSQTFAGSAPNAIAQVTVEAGSLAFANLAALEVSDLTIRNGATLSVGSAAQVAAEGNTSFSGVKVSNNAMLEGGATVSGGLDLTSTKTLTIDNIESNSITLNGALLLPSGERITLSGNILDTLAGLGKNDRLTLFTGVSSLELGGTSYNELAASEATDLSNYFTFDGLEQGNYQLGYADGVVSVQSLIPEPTTATLSLLALAGLAARRRRR